MFVVPNPTYPRDTLEKLFKPIYNLTTIVHVISLVVVMTEFYLRLSTSIPNYFTSSVFEMGSNLELVMTNCTYVGSVRMGSVTGSSEVSMESLPFGLMYVAQYTLGILIVQFLVIVNNGMNGMNYTSGNRHMRIFGTHVPYYHVLITFSYVYCIVLIVMVWTVVEARDFFSDAINHCVQQLHTLNETALLDAEFDTYHIFGTPILWPFGAAIVNIVIYTFGGLVLVVRSRHRALVLFSQADWPWERHTLTCTVVKQRLAAHARERAAILDEVNEAHKRGEQVHVIKSYRVISDDEYRRLDREALERDKKEVQDEIFQGMMTEMRDGQAYTGGRSAALPQFSWGRLGPGEPPPPYGGDSFMPDSFFDGEEFYDPDYPVEDEYFENDGDEYHGSPQNDDGGGGYFDDAINEDGHESIDHRDGNEMFSEELLDDRFDSNEDEEGENDAQEEEEYDVDEDGQVRTPRRKHRVKRKRKHRHHSHAQQKPDDELQGYTAFADDPASDHGGDDDVEEGDEEEWVDDDEDNNAPHQKHRRRVRRRHHSSKSREERHRDPQEL